MTRFSVFGTGFLQVFPISAQTYVISRDQLVGVFLIGFLISIVWSVNVKKIALSGWFDRIVYSSGAAPGAVSGVYVAARFF